MTQHRADESPDRRHFRSDRVVIARGQWYVVTRERMDVGPYPTRESAELAAEELSEALHGIDDPTVILALIREFIRRRNATIRNAAAQSEKLD